MSNEARSLWVVLLAGAAIARVGWLAGPIVGIVAGLAGAIAIARPARRFVVTAVVRAKLALVAAWGPAAAVVYAIGLALASDRGPWNDAFGNALVAGTLAIALAAHDALERTLRRPVAWLVLAALLVPAGAAVELVMRRQLAHLGTQEAKQALTPMRPEDLRFVGHPYELYTLRAGWTAPGGTDRHNTLGYRGPEIEQPKPAGRFRIVAVGGSTTYGTGVDRWQDAYPAQMAARLAERAPALDVDVVNAGAGGHTSWETLANVAFRVLDLDPDLVVVYQNTNDLFPRLVDPARYKSDGTGARRVWDQQRIDAAMRWPMRVPSVAWRFAVLRFGWFGIEPVTLRTQVTNECIGRAGVEEGCFDLSPKELLARNPPSFYRRNLESIVAMAEAQGARVLLLTFGHDHTFEPIPKWRLRGFAEHNEVLRGVAAERGTLFYALAPQLPDGPEYWADSVHMTETGEALRGRLVADFLLDTGVLPATPADGPVTSVP